MLARRANKPRTARFTRKTERLHQCTFITRAHRCHNHEDSVNSGTAIPGRGRWFLTPTRKSNSARLRQPASQVSEGFRGGGGDREASVLPGGDGDTDGDPGMGGGLLAFAFASAACLATTRVLDSTPCTVYAAPYHKQLPKITKTNQKRISHQTVQSTASVASHSHDPHTGFPEQHAQGGGVRRRGRRWKDGAANQVVPVLALSTPHTHLFGLPPSPGTFCRLTWQP